ncbi:MAG TPA: polysaccharide biosynthesis protein [Cyanobacteria bacterium UBA11369]|nr:polysaccharide biosynthesis protein [Cyanobacteria bacterium UBA11371]HBE32478.1 polysaccharide biosynthesis protein [Cyanobacteria bacterium UBA11368]HBE51958.1 polysaccharide biosynthesis protein [Cyanobacteria bacterium UBA11369]
MQQIKPLTLRRNFSWTFIGNAVYAACQWGMLVLLAKFGSREIVGQFTLGLAVTAPIVMLTNLQLRSVQATDAKHQYLFGDYLGLRLIGTGLALLLIGGITLNAGYRWETSLVVFTIGLAKGFESISDVFYGLIQQHERMDRIAISMMIKGPLSLVLLGAGLYFTGSVLWGTVGLVIAWAFVLFAYDIRSGSLLLGREASSLLPPTLKRGATQTKTACAVYGSKGGMQSKIPNSLYPRWHLKTLNKLVWLSLPLGLVMMLIALNGNIPQYFIEHYWGEGELGVFAAIAYLMVAGNMVVNALGQSASPRLAKYYAAGNRSAFRSLLVKLVVIGAILGGAAILVALVAGREILTLLYRPEYAQQKDLFVWLMVAAGIGYISSFLGYGMTAARYFRIQIPLFAAATGTAAIACLWLIPIMGSLGAAIALILAAIVQAIFSLGVIVYALHKIPLSLEDQS